MPQLEMLSHVILVYAGVCWYTPSRQTLISDVFVYLSPASLYGGRGGSDTRHPSYDVKDIIDG